MREIDRLLAELVRCENGPNVEYIARWADPSRASIELVEVQNA